MKTEFGDSVHKDLLTIAFALFVAAAALLVRAGPDDRMDLLTIGVGGTAALFAGIGLWLYRFHMRSVKSEAEANRTLMRERENLREVPKMAGEWAYEVKNSSVRNQKQMHSGRCVIETDVNTGPRSFKLYGTRLKHWDEGDKPADCNLDWESSWCEFTDQGEIRLAYEIDFEEERLQGYATLRPSGSPEVRVLKGNYSLYGPDGNRRTRGTITFSRDVKPLIAIRP